LRGENTRIQNEEDALATLLLRDGQVVDGTGGAAFKGHVLIDGDRIGAVIPEGQEIPPTDEEIDADGCVIAPGFIDMHSHSDWLLWDPDHPSVLGCLLEQGVTTVVGGNCGFSPAPVRAETMELVRHHSAMLSDRPVDFTWNTVSEFLDHVDKTEPVLNLAQLVGHASVRSRAADTLRGAMKPHEQKGCLDEVRCAFDAGACGLSFGLGYDPGMYSPLEEIQSLCEVAKESDKPVTVHTKALSKISPCYPATYLKPHNLRALREMLDIARKTGVRLQISHFIFVGRKSWSTADACLRMVDEARREGVDVMIDAFPYTCGNTTINAVFPYWFLARLPDGYRNAWARARLRAEFGVSFGLVGFFYRDFQVMDVAVPGWEELNGLTVEQIASKWGTSPLKALLKLSEASQGRTLMLFHAYSGEPGNEGPLESVLRHEACLFETDVVVKSTGYPNPAALGTFPKILGNYVRDRKFFSMENGIHRMTLASADRFGIKDRGALLPGKAADVVVFDPRKVSDTPPSGAEPAGKPKGIAHVFLNGMHVVKDGSYVAGSRAGQVLRG
jgi:N-acyl-D-amino-acid deacylase